MNRLLLRLVVTIGMLPATLVWCCGKMGFHLFVQDAFAGRPFALYLLVSGVFGITGMVYLYTCHVWKIEGQSCDDFIVDFARLVGYGSFRY